MGRLKPLWFSLFTLTLQTSALLVFIFPAVVFAQDVDTLSSVVNGGRTITDGSTHYRSDFSSISSNWTFNFSWPNSVANAQAFLGIARGTFGALEGGIPASGTNFVANYQAWPAGNSSLVKSLGFPLGSTSLPSGTYTVILAEASGSFNTSGTMNWFATGGSGGSAPSQHSFLTFNYINTERPPEYLDNAIQSVEHGNFTIADNAEVLRSSLSNENDFWLFNFSWPNAVANLQAGFYIFRGTFGNVNGGSAVSGNTYASNLQAWPAGNSSILKHMGLPLLTNPDTTPSVYTIMIAERNPLSASLQEEADWFASGGTLGRAPRKYSTLTFELKDQPACCSSVVFLPGIKGSNLKNGNDTLWPPSLVSFDDDILKLALNEDGTSVNPVQVDGVLENFYIASIYSGFTDFLESLETQEVIQDWLPVPYDWRYGPEKILADGVQTPTGIFDVIDEIEELALERSQTGKVTIVAHSMGGLLGKAIIKTLEEQGKGNLIDSFVMVGSPQLGTPQAVAGLLHGDDEGIGLSGLYYVVHPASSRAVSQNFQSAYNLLPSRVYFEATDDPVITFNENADFTQAWRDFWGTEGIQEYIDFFGFATGAGVLREDPSINELRIPEILRSDLMTAADDFHNEYDNYEPPSHVRVVQVAGWGLPTTKGVEYKNKHFLPGYQATTTVEGDGAVVYPSTLSSVGEKYFLNLDALEDVGRPFQHRDLLSVESVQTLIGNVIEKINIGSLSFISITKPEVAEIEDQLIVSTHSPVILGVYDAYGNFTGIDQGQDLNAQALLITQNIPGSEFLVSGDSQSVYLPKEGQYSFVYKGIGKGPTTVEVGVFSNDAETTLQSFIDLPTLAGTEAMFELDSNNPENTQLHLDKNGDDVVDYIITPSETGETIFPKAPLTITADSQKITLGDPLPEFSYEISGFVANETLETSDVTGEPECTTTATADSPVGTYTITCVTGTLSSEYYIFENFTEGTLTIEYQWKGFKQPIDDPLAQPGVTPSIFKAGSTVPVKFSLFDTGGNAVEATVTPQWLPPTKGTALVGGVDEPVSYESATSGNLFKYDPESKQYIYNWKTKGLASGYWYHIFVRLDDGSIRTVKVGLK